MIIILLQNLITPVSEVGSFIFMLDAYDHYTGGKRERIPDGGASTTTGGVFLLGNYINYKLSLHTVNTLIIVCFHFYQVM